jgi:pyrroline-5-carboxylate reductase
MTTPGSRVHDGLNTSTGSRSGPNRTLLAIIGGGTMAQAILRGAFDAKLLAPFEVAVVDPDPAKRALFGGWGVAALSNIREACDRLSRRVETDERTRDGQVLLAVKPQSLAEVAAELGPILAQTSRTVISILAGTPIAKLRASLNGPALPVVRVMPNTPAQLRKAMTAVSIAPDTPPACAELARDLFMSLGEVITIREELMDAFTALAGSGPAYVFHLAEAMLHAATSMGFDRITADRVVRQTILGSACLLETSNQPPGVLREQVTSKGGVTAAALASMNSGLSAGESVYDAIARAILAGRDRAAELAR